LKDGANTYRSGEEICCKNSLMPQTEVKHLLERAFCGDEWEYLKQNPKFQEILKQYEGTVVEHYEYLVEVGGLLLRQRKDLNLE
jgi:hypothetical protein